MNETELTIELEQVKAENRYLRHQLDTAFFEALRLRHVVESINAVSHVALHAGTGDGAGEARTTGTQPEY
jgi:hypothetical protein